MRSHSFALLLGGAALIACFPKRDLPPDEISKLTQLEHVMDVNGTIADPQFGKIGQATYTDQDYAQFVDVGTRLQATSTKAKEFSKGPEFDQFLETLKTKAAELADAGQKKDAKASSAALAEIKATCKVCHSKFK